MTLRVKYDELFKSWNVEYYNEWANYLHTCNEFYNGKDSYAAFKTEEEANEFMDWKYRKAERANKQFNSYIPCTIPDNYYGTPGRYYGD